MALRVAIDSGLIHKLGASKGEPRTASALAEDAGVEHELARECKVGTTQINYLTALSAATKAPGLDWRDQGGRARHLRLDPSITVLRGLPDLCSCYQLPVSHLSQIFSQATHLSQL